MLFKTNLAYEILFISIVDELGKEYGCTWSNIKKKIVVSFPIDYNKNFYALSEYFVIPKITKELDNIRQRELFKDVNFTIQILLNSETSNNCYETRLTMKIENFLSENINVCIENSKFKELPIPTIARILDQSKENVNHNLLLDFILESASHPSIFLIFNMNQKTNLNKNK